MGNEVVRLPLCRSYPIPLGRADPKARTLVLWTGTAFCTVLVQDVVIHDGIVLASFFAHLLNCKVSDDFA